MHKTFLSYHHANEQDLKDHLIEKYGGESFIDKSVSEGDINTQVSEDYIMRKIREDYLADTTVTVVLIGEETSQRPFVNSEIQASLWGDNPAGLIGVVRDEIYNLIFSPSICNDLTCGCGMPLRSIAPEYDLYLPDLIKRNHRFPKTAPHYSDGDVYCSVVKFSDFEANCEYYINQAYDKRKTIAPAAKRNDVLTPAIRTTSSLFNY